MTNGTLVLEGLKWCSVTEVAKVLNPGEGLVRWANTMGLQGKSLEQARDGSQGTGTMIHALVQRLVAGEQPVAVRGAELAGANRNGRSYAAALVDWWVETRPQALHCEESITSDRLCVTGRVDLIRRCVKPDCVCHGEGGHVTDFKTGGHRVYKESHLQLDGYLSIWPDGDLMPRHLCGAEIVTLGYDGRYAVHHGRCARGDFLAALDLWRRMEALNQPVSA